jgi:hypothetical protein
MISQMALTAMLTDCCVAGRLALPPVLAFLFATENQDPKLNSSQTFFAASATSSKRVSS